jgi:hypothetical protein
MDKRQKLSLAGVGVILVLCTVTAVTARGWTLHTPLYRVRMEQASSEMNFLPTDMSTFTYTAEKGYTLDYCAAGGCGVVPLATGPVGTCETCEYTCDDPTCPPVCLSTFRYTCTKPCQP